MNKIKEIMKENGIQPKWLVAELIKLGCDMDDHKLWRITSEKHNQEPTLFEANAFCMVLGVQTII